MRTMNLRRRAAHADSISEDDVGDLEDEPEVSGLGNRDVLLRFYNEKPRPENALLQKAAVFELLSLAQTAIFAHAVHALDPGGRASVGRLAESIVADGNYGALWKVPFSTLAKKAGSVRELEEALIEAEDAEVPGRGGGSGGTGGVLMARV